MVLCLQSINVKFLVVRPLVWGSVCCFFFFTPLWNWDRWMRSIFFILNTICFSRHTLIFALDLRGVSATLCLHQWMFYIAALVIPCRLTFRLQAHSSEFHAYAVLTSIISVVLVVPARINHFIEWLPIFPGNFGALVWNYVNIFRPWVKLLLYPKCMLGLDMITNACYSYIFLQKDCPGN